MWHISFDKKNMQSVTVQTKKSSDFFDLTIFRFFLYNTKVKTTHYMNACDGILKLNASYSYASTEIKSTVHSLASKKEKIGVFLPLLFL
jgi:hypothetical protein